MPTNGIFNFTTITVASGATLRFNRNPLNTPVYLLATGDVDIEGTIDVSGGPPSGRIPGPGGPGGFDGGWGGYGGTGFGGTGIGADGQGPGGGNHSNSGTLGYGPCYGSWPAAYGTSSSFSSGRTYGNSLLVPLIGGSGGAGLDGSPGGGGAGGGGAILIASSTKILLNGGINSSGGSDSVASGSGGAIRLVAPIVTGTGSLNTPGGAGSNFCGPDHGREFNHYGGNGRTRIDCIDGNSVQSLHAINTVSSRGRQMFVFPTNPLPRLDIIQAAGQIIPLGSPSRVSIVLPKGATNAQTVVVKATNFTNDVPITVAVLPNDGPSTTYQAQISLTNNPATVTVPVTLSVDSTNRIMVWTTPL